MSRGGDGQATGNKRPTTGESSLQETDLPHSYETWLRDAVRVPDVAPLSGPPSEGAVPHERYEDRGLIGHGGQGEVRRVFDRHVGRLLAMKILARKRFPPTARRQKERRDTSVPQPTGRRRRRRSHPAHLLRSR